MRRSRGGRSSRDGGSAAHGQQGARGAGAGVLITGSTSCATTDVVRANSLIDVAIRENRIEAQAPGCIVAQGDPANAVAGLTCSANTLAIRRGPDVEVIDVLRATCGS